MSDFFFSSFVELSLMFWKPFFARYDNIVISSFPKKPIDYFM